MLPTTPFSRSVPFDADSKSGQVLHRFTFPALGTTCEVQYGAPVEWVGAAGFERATVDWVQRFETRYSRFRPDSLVSRINAAAGREWVAVDPDMEQLFLLCDSLYAMTAGVMDPTLLPLMRLWNWKEPPATLPTAGEIARARSLVGWTKVQRNPGRVFLPEPGMALDFGGFGKEFAVDLVAQLALDQGLGDVLVDFGHDIRVLGTPPGRPAWHIGLENPRRPGQAWSSLAVSGSKGIASSGDYVRCFHFNGRRYGHIIDPRTGRPVANGCLQSTVIADTCLQAGVLATAAFVMGMKEGIDLIQNCPRAEGLVIADHVRAQTRGFFHHVAH